MSWALGRLAPISVSPPRTSRRGEGAEGHKRLGPPYPGAVENMLV
jgi:hypothetical protein